METYDRYHALRKNGAIGIVPFVKIPKRSTDYYERYNRVSNKLDLISYKYYNNPNYGWLILQANPHLESIEQAIPNGTILRVPYPLEAILTEYGQQIEKHLY